MILLCFLLEESSKKARRKLEESSKKARRKLEESSIVMLMKAELLSLLLLSDTLFEVNPRCDRCRIFMIRPSCSIAFYILKKN